MGKKRLKSPVNKSRSEKQDKSSLESPWIESSALDRCSSQNTGSLKADELAVYWRKTGHFWQFSQNQEITTGPGEDRQLYVNFMTTAVILWEQLSQRASKRVNTVGQDHTSALLLTHFAQVGILCGRYILWSVYIVVSIYCGRYILWLNFSVVDIYAKKMITGDFSQINTRIKIFFEFYILFFQH